MPIERRAGLKINSLTLGRGDEQALLLHCSLANSRAWLPFAGEFKDKLSMIAFDLPGHGMSQDWGYTSDYQDCCLDITATFINKPIHLVGHSFGATVALRLAHRFPDFVKSLSLIEPVFFAAAFSDHRELEARFMLDHADYFSAGEDKNWRLAAKLFLKLWGNNEDWNLLSENKKRQFSKRIPLTFEVSKAIYMDPHEMLKEHAFSSLTAKSSIIYGDRSHFIMPYISKALSARIPNTKLSCIQNAGHMLPITHPKICAQIIDKLIEP
jgi:pimeloyl-ACP methyl ester carboxylesterase